MRARGSYVAGGLAPLLLLGLLMIAPAAHALSLAPLSVLARWWQAAPRPPRFPAAFEAEYVFSLPYVYTVQTQGLAFPVRVWYDGPASQLRTDVYGGLDSTLAIKDTTYMLYPRINVTVCDTINGDVGPTLAAGLLGAAPLPDISGWSYAGTTSIADTQVHVWQMFDKQAGKVSSYTFYTTEEGTPVRFYEMGYNILAGSHFDEYLVDFLHFKAGPIDNSVFTRPQLCSEARQQQQQQQQPAHPQQRERAAAQAVSASLALMPWARLAGSGAGAGALAAQQQRGAALRRLAARAQSAAFVASWNARVAAAAPAAAGASADSDSDAPRFRLALNRFTDWLPEEYAAVATARRSSARADALAQAWSLGVVSPPPGLSKRHLPSHVDWRGTGADNIVKDQATCGSCWAFSAVGAMQGAWHLATGEVLSLSEQQLVDCSWDYGNNGCQGGNMEPAIKYVADAGGASAEEDYQYQGQNMFCGSNATHVGAAPAASFAGFAHVHKRSELALMWAVWRHGPVAVSIDASLPTFKFYSEGVYRDRRCKSGRDELDHAVLVVGYGTDKLSGSDYWLIKNSWSKLWGEDGYIRMARTPGSGNDCGITTDPVLAVVKKRHARPGSAAAELHAQLEAQAKQAAAVA